jgi:hypothetical protein
MAIKRAAPLKKRTIPESMVAKTAMAPRTVMPERAFIPDIRGVCNSEGTDDIILYPRIAQASRKINKATSIELLLPVTL